MEEFMLNYGEYITAFTQDPNPLSISVGVVATLLVVLLRKIPGKLGGFAKKVVIEAGEKLKKS